MDNNYEKIAKNIYSKIDIFLRENKMNRYEIADKIGVSKQTISDILLKLKDGKFPKLKTLLKLQDYLGIELIFFNL